MLAEDHLTFLRNSPLLSDARLDDAALCQLRDGLELERYPAGESIFRQGDAADGMYFVLKGRVGIFGRAGEGRRQLAELSAGAYFGELALVDGGTRSADADAIEQVEVLRLSADRFDSLIDEYPRLALCFLRLTGKRLRTVNAQVAASGENVAPAAAADPLTDTLPYPIAAVHRSFRVLVDPRKRLERFFDLLEVTLRYLGTVAIAAHVASDQSADFADEMLVGGISKVSLGRWIGLVREIGQTNAADPSRLFIPELISVSFDRPGRRSRVSRRIDEVLRFRNQQRHGAGGALDEAKVSAALDELVPKLEEVLAALSFLTDYPIVLLERMDFQGGKFVYQFQRCMGSHGDFETDSVTLPIPYETRRLYWLHKDGASLLPAYPLLVMDEAPNHAYREILFFMGVEGAEAQYAEFIHGHHLALEEPCDSIEAMRRAARDRLHRSEKE